MAVSTAVPTQRDDWHDSKRLHSVGTVAVGASALTYVTGGIAFSLWAGKVKANTAPVWIDVQGIGGYIYCPVYGTDGSLTKLIIMQNGAGSGPNLELAASAIPSGVSGDTITYHAIFKFGA